MSRLLIVTAKLPNEERDLDGGTTTVANLIKMLSIDYTIDLLYFNPYEKLQGQKMEGVDTIYEIDARILDYSGPNAVEKFISRMNLADKVAENIRKYIDDCDLCFVIHCWMSLKLHEYLSNDMLKKIVLFPMFLTPSYTKALNSVPKEYTLMEENALRKVGAIITPSETERKQLTDIYHINSEKIFVIPRSIGSFQNEIVDKKCEENVKVITVTSFRNQKNVIDTIKCIDEVITEYSNVHLYIVGPVQQENILNECVEYIKERRLDKYISILPPMPADEVIELYKQMDLSLSTSLYETFGRSIFEGMAMGIPTMVYECLDVVKDTLNDNGGIRFYKSYKEMARGILDVICNKKLYQEMSRKACLVGTEFSFETEAGRIQAFIGEYIKNCLEL